MTEEQSERLVLAFERLATIAESWLEKSYPAPLEIDDEEAQVYRAGDAREKKPETPEEYKDFPEDSPGRFESLLKAISRTKTE